MEKTLKEHLRAAAKIRWAKRTPEERKAFSKMMSEKRWPKKK